MRGRTGGRGDVGRLMLELKELWDWEGEWKKKLAIPCLWDEGFEELEGSGGRGGDSPKLSSCTVPSVHNNSNPNNHFTYQKSTIRHNQHLPHRLLSHFPTLNLHHLAPPPTPLQDTTYRTLFTFTSFALRPSRYCMR